MEFIWTVFVDVALNCFKLASWNCSVTDINFQGETTEKLNHMLNFSIRYNWFLMKNSDVQENRVKRCKKEWKNERQSLKILNN